MRTRALTILVLSGSLLAEDPGGFSLTVTNDFLFQKNDLATGPNAFLDPARRPNQFQESLSLFGQSGHWSFGLTLRDVNFYLQDANTTLERPHASLYRKFVRFSAEGWSAQAGDFYALLGRGMVLSVVQNDKLLKERTLEGAEVRYQGGAWDLRALGGTVTTETLDQRWRVYGGEALVDLFRGNRLGLRASQIEDMKTPQSVVKLGTRLTRSASLAGDNLWEVFNYYAEVGHVDYKDQEALPFASRVDPRKGDASYGNLVYHQGAVFLMAEYKKYNNFDNELNNPPLADRDTEKNQLVDSAGHRLYGQYSFRNPDLTLLASGGRVREGLRWGSHVYGGFKIEDWFERVNASYTYGMKTLNYLEKKTDAGLTYRFTPLWSMEFIFRDKRHRLPGTDPYDEQDLTAQVARSPWGAVFFTRQSTSTPVFDATQLYSGGVRVNLPKGSYVELSGGRLRGGEVCAGGQCINLPPFKGWKIAAHLVFK